MTRLVCKLIFLVMVSSNLFASECDRDLGTLLKSSVIQNQDLFVKLHLIAQMKLASKLSKDPFQSNVIQERIERLQATVDPGAAAELYKKASNSFILNGKDQTYQDAVYFSERRNIKLTPAIAGLLVKNLEKDECLKANSCINENDLATLWLGKKLGLYRQDADLIKSLSNHKTPKIYLKSSQGEKAFDDLLKRFSSKNRELLSEFQVEEQLCGGISDKVTCSTERHSLSVQNKMNEFGNIIALSKEKALSERDSRELLGAIQSSYLEQASAENINRAPASISEYENRFCGGVEFDPKLRNKEVFGFNDSRGALKGSRDAFSTYKKEGIAGLKSLNAGSSKNAGEFKGAKFLNMISIPGPMFRCEPESPIMVPKVGKLKADRKVCCEEEVRQGSVKYYFFSWGGGVNCRAFFGLPYLAEVGAKIGAGFNFTLAGGTEPHRCEERTCFQASPMVNVSAGLYAEALGGAGSIQGTISWVPYMAIKQCVGSFSHFLPPADFSYQVGRVLAIVNARLGWAFSYNEVKVIYEDDNTKHTSVPLF